MKFTFNSRDKIYELRNKMNSTVKRMSEVAILFDEDSGGMVQYGESFQINKELQKLAEAKKYHYCVVRSVCWNLDYLNRIIDGSLRYPDIEGNRNIADKFFTAYYPNPHTKSDKSI